MVFASKTKTNGITQVYSSIELQDLKIYGTGCILTHKNEIHKGLINYWLDQKQLDKLRSVVKVENSDF